MSALRWFRRPEPVIDYDVLLAEVTKVRMIDPTPPPDNVVVLRPRKEVDRG